MTTFYRAGQHFALTQMKLSSERVPVTRDETFQYRPDPAYINDARGQAGMIDATWDAHDRRFQTSIKSPAATDTPLSGGDG